jgi:ribonuclease HII
VDISLLQPDFTLETRLWESGYRVVGIDEAGRGAWAGPLFVGAVWLKPQHVVALADIRDNIKDSKLLTSRQRVEIYRHLISWGIEYAVGDAQPHEIDQHGLEKAFEIASARAFHSMIAQGLLEFPLTEESPLAVLIDGRRYADIKPIPNLEIFAEDKLDNASVAVALASICAKVHQETNSHGLHFIYPEYGFDRHHGYPTAAHREAVEKYGLSHQHRKSWKVNGSE